MDPTDLAFAGVTRQAELMRAGEISARELVELYLERIGRLNHVLNAYRVVFAERALAEARQADARRAAGEERPLLGIAIAIKDDCDVAGEVTAYGSNAHDGPASADAEVVRRLRSAGAVVLGKTNVPELAITPWTESPIFGVTRNPWDLQRTSGGSSGGSATAVAAGLCAAAIGSDGAGSIRIPAAATGLFGLKPQRGRVPTSPKSEYWCGMTSWGAIARRVADTAQVSDVIRDGGPSYADAAAQEPGRLRIAVVRAAPPTLAVRADAEQLGALEGTADLLRDLGHDVVEGTMAFPQAALVNVMARYLGGVPELVDTLPHPERLSRQAKGFLRMGRAVPTALVERAKASAGADAVRLNSVFDGGVDLVLTPMFTRRPPPVGEYAGRPAWWALNASMRLVPWCAAYNHTGQPAAAVPAGFTPDGFPLAVQLVARMGGEDLLLGLGAQLERARDWPAHVPPVAA